MQRRAHVTLVVKLWSGWTKDPPVSKSLQLILQAGQKLTPATVGIQSDAYEIYVDSVRADRIIVVYSGMVMNNDDGTVNMFAPRRGCVIIQIQHRMSLSSATTDAGTSVALTLDRIEECES